MSATLLPGAPKILFVPRCVQPGDVPPTRFGVGLRRTPEGGWTCDEGTGNPLNWEWWAERKILGLQLLCGSAVRSTRVTSGEFLNAGGEGQEVAGDLFQLFEVVSRRLEDTGGGTQVRGAAPPDPSGLLVLKGDGLVSTPEGLGWLNGVFTSGGDPRGPLDPSAQAGKVPAGVDVMARFASWRPETYDKGWSFPIRFGLEVGDGTAPPPRVPTGTGTPQYGAGTFRREEGPPVRVIQTLPDGREKVVREDDPSTRPPNSTAVPFPALHAALNAEAARQKRVLDLMAPLLAMRERAFAEGRSFSPVGRPPTSPEVQLAVLEIDLANLNRSIRALGGDPGALPGTPGGLSATRTSASRRGASDDLTAHTIDEDTVEIWGWLDPFDEDTDTWLDEAERGRDPERYKDRARWAPHVLLSMDKLITHLPPPPPPQPPPPPPPPPPPWNQKRERDLIGTTGGSGGTRTPTGVTGSAPGTPGSSSGPGSTGSSGTGVTGTTPSGPIFAINLPTSVGVGGGPANGTVPSGTQAHDGLPVINQDGNDATDHGFGIVPEYDWGTGLPREPGAPEAPGTGPPSGDDPSDAPDSPLGSTRERPPTDLGGGTVARPPAECPLAGKYIPGGIGIPGTPTWGGARNR